MNNRTLVILASMAVLMLVPELVQAQGGLADPEAIAGQNLRGYTHMFIAYAIAWAMVFGWVISIARRLGRVERALEE
jgi:CcmD family protein